jgi:hypothetical protein
VDSAGDRLVDSAGDHFVAITSLRSVAIRLEDSAGPITAWVVASLRASDGYCGGQDC